MAHSCLDAYASVDCQGTTSAPSPCRLGLDAKNGTDVGPGDPMLMNSGDCHHGIHIDAAPLFSSTCLQRPNAVYCFSSGAVVGAEALIDKSSEQNTYTCIQLNYIY